MDTERSTVVLSRCWKLMTLKGSLGILVGFASTATLVVIDSRAHDLFGVSFFLEAATLAACLILYLGLYSLLDGVCAFTMGFRLYGYLCRWWALIGKGFLGLGFCVGLWTWPRTLLPHLPHWIAIWAFSVGTLEVVQGLDPKGYPARRRQCLSSGALTWTLGILLVTVPFGGHGLIGLLSAYALLSAVPILLLASHLRGLAGSYEREGITVP